MPLRRRMRILPETRVDQLRQRLDRLALIGALGRDGDGRSARGREQENPHDALAVHLPGLARDPHVRLKPGRQMDEFRRRARVHAELVHDRHVFRSHLRLRPHSRNSGLHTALLPAQQIRRDPDGVPAVIAHLTRDAEQVGRAPQPGELDQHR